MIPESHFELLGLIPLDEVPVAGFGGRVILVTTYVVELGLSTLPPQSVEVIAHCDEPYILLGRDILNRHRLLPDGPSLILEIG